MELDRLLDLDEEDLLLKLDELVYGDQAMTGMGRYERILRSRAWLARFVERKREALCGSLQGVDSYADTLIEAATVVDALVSVGLHKPSATVAAAILAKWGVQNICGGTDDRMRA